MAYPIGGRIIVGYASAGRDFEQAIPLAPFNPSTFAYTAGGLVTPIEADVGQTFLALAAVMAPYYDASWVFTIKSIWQQTGGDASMLPTVPTVGSVAGTSTSTAITEPALMRGFTFYSALGSRQRLRLFMVAANEAGQRRAVTPTAGGFDGRDRNLIGYLSGAATGLRCWDGVPFPASASAYVRSMQPGNTTVLTDGAIFTDESLIWPLGGKISNPTLDTMTIETPGGTFTFDSTGITLPGGGRIEAGDFIVDG